MHETEIPSWHWLTQDRKLPLLHVVDLQSNAVNNTYSGFQVPSGLSSYLQGLLFPWHKHPQAAFAKEPWFHRWVGPERKPSTSAFILHQSPLLWLRSREMTPYFTLARCHFGSPEKESIPGQTQSPSKRGQWSMRMNLYPEAEVTTPWEPACSFMAWELLTGFQDRSWDTDEQEHTLARTTSLLAMIFWVRSALVLLVIDCHASWED